MSISGLCTGNVGNAASLHYIQTLSSNVYVARNELDCYNSTFNATTNDKLQSYQSITIGEFKFLLYNNYTNNVLIDYPSNNDSSSYTIDTDQCIYELAKHNSDIMIIGSSQQSTIIEYADKLIVSPGTLTGAQSPHSSNASDVVPSFILIAVKGAKAVVYTYELHNGEVTVNKTEHVKTK